MRKVNLLAGYVCAAVLGGCAATPFDVAGTAAPLELRSVQTRAYEHLDKTLTMRAVIATLQDFGFTIDQADTALGIVTGTRAHSHDMRMTVTVVQKTADEVSVRASARVGQKSITEAATYQDFFAALDKGIFLVRNNVN